jgi:hypothetical protein
MMGGVEIKKAGEVERQVHMILWGPSGAGKTELASTFPGNKLWLQFDPNGTASLGIRDDIYVVDFVEQIAKNPAFVERFKEADPLGISKLIKQLNISTVVFDTMTSFGEASLQHGVEHAAMTKQHRGASIEDPGYGGYGRKKTWTKLAFVNTLRACAALKVNTCFIMHEDSPEKNDQGQVLYITMMLGSDLPDMLSCQISEVWNLTDTGTERRIAVRPVRQRKPMKSRMFKVDGPGEFVWKYDPLTRTGMTVAGFLEQWKQNQWNKIPIPK